MKPTVLILGCGRKQDIARYGLMNGTTPLTAEDVNFLTLDGDASVNPTLVCDLGNTPIPLPEDSVDLAVALHVLEHIGVQGDTRQWFSFWEDLYRVLRPGGVLQLECPLHSSVWAWADPTHVRGISEYTFLYFNQDSYRHKDSAIPTYRIRADFEPIGWQRLPDGGNADVREVETHSMLQGRLRARKPFKGWWEDLVS